MSLAERVRVALSSALDSIATAGQLGDGGARAVEGAAWVVERPKRPEHGDLSTNLALALAKPAGRPPRAIAEALVRALAADDVIASAEVAGPGFVNLRVRPAVFHAELSAILAAGRAWGRAPAATADRVNIEFVSANPTGPVTVASGRNAILGDSVARLLEATGHRVAREYYINDRGNQVKAFAESVRAAHEGREPPSDGYKGPYVAELAAWFASMDASLLVADDDRLGRACVTWMLRGLPGSRTLPGIRPSLADLRVVFDVWFSEESLHRSGQLGAVMSQLEAGGHLLRHDGALFFKAPEGALEDKDRVVQKSDGTWAYFASDIAYFADKIARGYDRLIDVLGADHHGYVARVSNALTALGLPQDRFEALLYQLVFITKDGVAVKSSKRAGNIVTVDEIMDEIDEAAARKGAGADALRFFFLSRSAGSNVEFDIELAKKRTLDNPVFYVQYGHARLCSILRKSGELGFGAAGHLAGAEWAKLAHADELAIAHRLGDFPDVVAEAARLREPHRIVFYVQELARDFQSYFTRLKGEADPILPPASVRASPDWEKTWDYPKTRARLAWIEAIRAVYAGALELIGVSAPDRMDRPAGGAQEMSGADSGRRGRGRTATETRARPAGVPGRLPRCAGGLASSQLYAHRADNLALRGSSRYGLVLMAAMGDSFRNIERIEEDDDARKIPWGVTTAFVVLGGACITFAVLALGGRTSAAPQRKSDPLGDLLAERSHAAAQASGGAAPAAAPLATELSPKDVTFPEILSDSDHPATAMAAVPSSGAPIASRDPAAMAPPPPAVQPPPPTDRLSVVPLPAQAVLEATPVVTRPRDPLTRAASDAAKLDSAAVGSESTPPVTRAATNFK